VHSAKGALTVAAGGVDAVSAVLSKLDICGSLEGSYNEALLRVVQWLAPSDTSIEIADLSEIPLYNADVEAQGLPQAVRMLRTRLRTADALLFSTAECNDSIPGAPEGELSFSKP